MLRITHAVTIQKLFNITSALFFMSRAEKKIQIDMVIKYYYNGTIQQMINERNKSNENQKRLSMLYRW